MLIQYYDYITTDFVTKLIDGYIVHKISYNLSTKMKKYIHRIQRILSVYFQSSLRAYVIKNK